LTQMYHNSKKPGPAGAAATEPVPDGRGAGAKESIKPK
jgi:hypothetical protein